MGGIIGLIILVLDIVALVGLWKSAAASGKKVLWTVLILLLPVIGLVLYFLIGKKGA